LGIASGRFQRRKRQIFDADLTLALRFDVPQRTGSAFPQ